MLSYTKDCNQLKILPKAGFNKRLKFMLGSKKKIGFKYGSSKEGNQCQVYTRLKSMLGYSKG